MDGTMQQVSRTLLTWPSINTEIATEGMRAEQHFVNIFCKFCHESEKVVDK